MSNQVQPLEKKVIAVALLASAVHLSLIAFAALRLGITVPTCVTEVKPFEMGSLTKVGDKRYEIHVLAKMWGFEPARIRLPAGSVADIYVISRDVTHGFHVNGTNVNLMAVPNVVNNAQVTFRHPGMFPVVCHEYCGTGHQAMNGSIEVIDGLAEADADGVVAQAQGQTTQPAKLVAQSDPPGRVLALNKGCLACHSVDGSVSVGPSFKGLYGRTETLADGSSIAVDAAYIRESIREPQKKLVKGFGPLMPPIPISDGEIEQITQYIGTLK